MPKEKHDKLIRLESRAKKDWSILWSFVKRHWIDIIIIIFLATLAYFEFTEFKDLSPKIQDFYSSFNTYLEKNNLSSGQDRFYVNMLIVEMFPLVDTILAVSLSVSRHNVYGVDFKTFRSLIYNSHYSLTGMIVVSILLFVEAIVFFYLDLIICAIVVAVIALIYMVYFICREIPLMWGSDKHLNNVVAKSYKFAYTKQKKDFDKRSELENVILYLFKEKGVTDTIDILKKDKTIESTDLKAILGIANNRIYSEIINSKEDNQRNLFNLLDDIYNFYISKRKFIDPNVDGTIKEEEYLEFMKLLDNILSLFEKNIINEEYFSSYFARLIPCIDGITDSDFNRVYTNSEYFATIVTNFLAGSLDHQNILLSKTLSLVLFPDSQYAATNAAFKTTLKHVYMGSLSFEPSIKDCSNDYLVFLVILFDFIIEKCNISADFKVQMKKLKRDSILLCLASIISSSYKAIDDCTKLLKSLFAFYSSSSPHPYCGNNGLSNLFKNKPSRVPFEKYVVDWWFNLLFSNNVPIVKNFDKILIDNFNSHQIEVILSTYSTDFQGCNKNKSIKSMTNKFFDSIKKSINYEDADVRTILSMLDETYKSLSFDNLIKERNEKQKDIDIKSKYTYIENERNEFLSFYSGNMSDDIREQTLEQTIYFSKSGLFGIDDFDKAIEKQFGSNSGFNIYVCIICKTIDDQELLKDKYIEIEKYNDSIIDDIFNFNPTKKSTLDIMIKREVSKDNSKLSSILAIDGKHCSFIPPDAYLKDDAIMLDVIDLKFSNLIDPSDKETEEYVTNYYNPIYFNNPTNNVFYYQNKDGMIYYLSQEDIMKLLKGDLLKVEVTLTYKIEINPNGFLLYTRKKK